MQADTISVGDLVQRVAADASMRILSMLEAMPAQTPELRFEKMKACIARLKKQLCQLLALLMWLRDENVQKYLSSVRNLTADIVARQMQLNGVQDAFYFLHQSIYKRRRQALDVSFASDIVARGTYAHLPASIFDFGAAATKIKKTEANAADTAEMNLFIGCKLCLGDPITDKIDRVDVKEGILTLTKDNAFEISLTLSERIESAHWVVNRVEFLVEHRNTEGFIDSYGHIDLEENVKNALNSFLRHKSENQVENMLADKSILNSVYCLCQHVVLSVCLKLLYIQANYNSRNLSEGYTAVSYTENEDAIVLEFSFWAHLKGRSSVYPHMMRVSLTRDVQISALKLCLFRVLEPTTQGIEPVAVEMALPQPLKEDILSSMTRSGASFSAGLSAVLFACAGERLKLAFVLLSRCLEFMSSAALFVVEMDSADKQCIVIRDKGRNFICIDVCAITGKFIVANTGVSWNMLTGASDCLALFMGELNGIIMEMNIKRIASYEEAISRFHGFEFRTVSKLLRYFLLLDEHSDYELLCGAVKSIPVQWMERLARNAGLEGMVYAMYTVSRSSEAHTVAQTKKLVQYEILSIFAITVDEGMKKSYHILSGCVAVEKHSLPLFGEIFELSGPISQGAVDISRFKSSPLLSLLRSHDSVSPTALSRFVSGLLQVRIGICLAKSGVKIGVLLQQQKLDMEAITAYSNINQCVNESLSNAFSCPIMDFLLASVDSENNVPASWSLAECGDGIGCAVSTSTKSTVFFIDMTGVISSLNGYEKEVTTALSEFECFSDELVSMDEMNHQTSTAIGPTLSFLDILQPMQPYVSAIKTALIRNRFLFVKSIGSFCEPFYILLECSRAADKFKNLLLRCSGEVNQLCRAIGDNNRVTIRVEPLKFVLRFEKSRDSKSEEFLDICTAYLSYRVFSRASNIGTYDNLLKPFHILCHSCEISSNSLIRSRFSTFSTRNYLGLCQTLINFALQDMMGSSLYAETYDILCCGLLKVAHDVFPAILLADSLMRVADINHTEREIKSAGNCLSFCNVTYCDSFSIIVSEPSGESIVAFCDVDIEPLKGVDNSSSWVYVISQRLGVMNDAVGKIFRSSDPEACANFILS